MLGGDNMVNEKKRTESYSRGILGVPCPHLVWPKSPGVIRLIDSAVLQETADCFQSPGGHPPPPLPFHTLTLTEADTQTHSHAAQCLWIGIYIFNTVYFLNLINEVLLCSSKKKKSSPEFSWIDLQEMFLISAWNSTKISSGLVEVTALKRSRGWDELRV